MTVEPLVPDTPPAGGMIPTPQMPAPDDPLVGEFQAAIGSVGGALSDANTAQQSFINGTGSLQSMVFERARADALLEVASSVAQHAGQELNQLLNMQV